VLIFRESVANLAVDAKPASFYAVLMNEMAPYSDGCLNMEKR